jgi:predicted nuclease of predicted toxin-antitoxin system
VRFLLDANISPLVATRLIEAGHSAVHVRDVGLRAASDEQIMDLAAQEDRVIVSQDIDFTNLLYYRRASRPSLILLRNLPEVTAAQIAQLITANLPQLEDSLSDGAAVSIVGDRLRVRRLPLR